MKAQQRHDLHSNFLADWLEDTFQKLKPYGRAIVGVVVAVAIIFAIYAYVSALERRNVTAASDHLLGAMDNPIELQDVIDTHKGSPPAILAQLMVAETQLKDGTNLQYTNRPAARQNLGKAAEMFAQVDQSTHDSMLRAWALYGEGRASEAMGELDRAKTDYQNMLKLSPDGSLADAAKRHLAQLDRTSVKEFYDWFAKQDPRPPATDKEPGVPGLKPTFDFTDPNTGSEFKLPSTPGSGFPGLPTDTSTPKAETSGEGDKAASENGGADKGSTEKGASDQMPAGTPKDSAKPDEGAKTDDRAKSSDDAKPSDAGK
ncbi:MAG TPA: hypothetical protein VGJ15_00135 [Pirellulales bacterium]|jgi:tetratricopeptide (TPR) repeat protein